MDLSRKNVKQVLHGWSMNRIHGCTHSPGAIGKCLTYAGIGRTTPIVAIDRTTRRVLTVSGSVYQLGSPKLEFAVDNGIALKELGVL